MPLGVNVRDPALRLSKAWLKVVVVSPVCRLPKVGVSVEVVVPSYVLLSVTAVTVIARVLIVPVAVLNGSLELLSLLPSFTVLVGGNVREPTLRLSKACEKVVVVSPDCRLPKVGVSDEVVVPSYVLLSVTAEMVSARLLIVPVTVPLLSTV